MITNKPMPKQKKQHIDLSGPQGNGFYLLGTARDLLKQMKKSKDEIDEIMKDMQSSNYEHLIQVFDNHFGEFIDLHR